MTASPKTPASRTVIFEHSFVLPGDSLPHPPGSFELRIEQEELDVVWGASRMRYALILPSPGGYRSVTLHLAELEELLRLDRVKSAGPASL